MTFEERVCAVAARGYTDRQARFLVTVMLHGGVCMSRQYCAFTRLVHGQKVRDFFATLVAQRVATPFASAQRRTRLYHVHSRSLYAAIGEADNRFRKPVSLARAIERLMLLDVVIEHRDVTWLATERDKLAHFTRLLGTRFRREDLPLLMFEGLGQRTVRYFPDKLPVGVRPDESGHIFLYLITRDAPVDFRAFLHRHAELLRALPAWTIRLLTPRHFAKATTVFVGACHQELASPLRPALADEIRWYFERLGRLRAQVAPSDAAERERLRRARAAFSAPRYGGLYRAWQRQGRAVVDATVSPVLAESLQRGTGRIECQMLTRRYLHLSPLVGTS